MGVLRVLGASAAARVVTLPIAVGLSLATTWATIDAVDSHGFALVALVTGVLALIPFADLGVGAAVTNAVAGSPNAATDDHVSRTVLSSMRLLAASATAIAAIALTGTAAGLWSPLLGAEPRDGATIDVGILAALCLFAASLPFGVGQRVLLGSGRQPTAVAVSVAAPATAFMVVMLARMVDASLLVFMVAQPLAFFMTAVLGAYVAQRRTGVLVLLALRRVPQLRRHRGVAIAHTARPMLVIMIGLPLALQTHRYVVAHLEDTAALAAYALAAQFYAPLWSVVATAGASLWPHFVKLQGTAGSTRAWRASTTALAGAAVALGAGLVAAAGPVSVLLSGGRVTVGAGLAASFALLLVVQAAHYPAGMALTRPHELRFQARCVVAMALVTLPLSLLLTTVLGAAGPVVASAAAIAVTQLAPGVRRMLHDGARIERATPQVAGVSAAGADA